MQARNDDSVLREQSLKLGKIAPAPPDLPVGRCLGGSGLQ